MDAPARQQAALLALATELAFAADDGRQEDDAATLCHAMDTFLAGGIDEAAWTACYAAYARRLDDDRLSLPVAASQLVLLPPAATYKQLAEAGYDEDALQARLGLLTDASNNRLLAAASAAAAGEPEAASDAALRLTALHRQLHSIEQLYLVLDSREVGLLTADEVVFFLLALFGDELQADRLQLHALYSSAIALMEDMAVPASLARLPLFAFKSYFLRLQLPADRLLSTLRSLQQLAEALFAARQPRDKELLHAAACHLPPLWQMAVLQAAAEPTASPPSSPLVQFLLAEGTVVRIAGHAAGREREMLCVELWAAFSASQGLPLSLDLDALLQEARFLQLAASLAAFEELYLAHMRLLCPALTSLQPASMLPPAAAPAPPAMPLLPTTAAGPSKLATAAARAATDSAPTKTVSLYGAADAVPTVSASLHMPVHDEAAVGAGDAHAHAGSGESDEDSDADEDSSGDHSGRRQPRRRSRRKDGQSTATRRRRRRAPRMEYRRASELMREEAAEAAAAASSSSLLRGPKQWRAKLATRAARRPKSAAAGQAGKAASPSLIPRRRKRPAAGSHADEPPPPAALPADIDRQLRPATASRSRPLPSSLPTPSPLPAARRPGRRRSRDSAGFLLFYRLQLLVAREQLAALPSDEDAQAAVLSTWRAAPATTRKLYEQHAAAEQRALRMGQPLPDPSPLLLAPLHDHDHDDDDDDADDDDDGTTPPAGGLVGERGEDAAVAAVAHAGRDGDVHLHDAATGEEAALGVALGSVLTALVHGNLVGSLEHPMTGADLAALAAGADWLSVDRPASPAATASSPLPASPHALPTAAATPPAATTPAPAVAAWTDAALPLPASLEETVDALLVEPAGARKDALLQHLAALRAAAAGSPSTAAAGSALPAEEPQDAASAMEGAMHLRAALRAGDPLARLAPGLAFPPATSPPAGVDAAVTGSADAAAADAAVDAAASSLPSRSPIAAPPRFPSAPPSDLLLSSPASSPVASGRSTAAGHSPVTRKPLSQLPHRRRRRRPRPGWQSPGSKSPLPRSSPRSSSSPAGRPRVAPSRVESPTFRPADRADRYSADGRGGYAAPTFASEQRKSSSPARARLRGGRGPSSPSSSSPSAAGGRRSRPMRSSAGSAPPVREWSRSRLA